MDMQLSKEQIERGRAFLKDLLAVYEKHNIVIAHEDEHGSFLLEFDSVPEDRDDRVRWIKNSNFGDFRSEAEGL